MEPCRRISQHPTGVPSTDQDRYGAAGLSSGDAICQGTSAACCQRQLNWMAKFPSSASLHCPISGASVSRLSGKSDSTAKRPGWQVACSASANDCTQAWAAPAQLEHTEKRHPRWEWRFGLLHWSLAPGIFLAGVVAPCRLRLSRPVFPSLKGRIVGGSSCRVPAVLGLAEVTPAAGTSLALI